MTSDKREFTDREIALIRSCVERAVSKEELEQYSDQDIAEICRLISLKDHGSGKNVVVSELRPDELGSAAGGTSPLGDLYSKLVGFGVISQMRYILETEGRDAAVDRCRLYCTDEEKHLCSNIVGLL